MESDTKVERDIKDTSDEEFTEIPLGDNDVFEYSKCSECWRSYCWIPSDYATYPPTVCQCNGNIFWDCLEPKDTKDVIDSQSKIERNKIG